MTERSSTGSPAVLRRLNSALVLQTVRRHGPISRTELAAEAGLSKPTVNEIVEVLLEDGYVTERIEDDGDRPLRPGPRPRLLRFRADRGYVLGIDIGADKILALVADLDGELVGSARQRTSSIVQRGPEPLLAEVVAVARAALASARVGLAKVKAVGVGTPGVVDPASGRVSLAPQLPGWEEINIAERLGRVFRCPVLVEKELLLSTLAERWRGAAQGIDDAVYIQLGIGVGAGLLIGGELYRGADGAAGEIGYLRLGKTGQPSQLGFGDFEWSAGGIAVARLGRAAAESRGGAPILDLAGGNPDAIDAKIVFEAAAQGNTAAAAIVDQVVGRIAQGIAAVVCVLNPATVIVGGGMSRAGAAILEPLKEQVAGFVPIPPRLVLSTLGDEAVALGAVHLVMQAVDESFFALVVSEESGRRKATENRRFELDTAVRRSGS